jgi:hypothetical protein
LAHQTSLRGNDTDLPSIPIGFLWPVRKIDHIRTNLRKVEAKEQLHLR